MALTFTEAHKGVQGAVRVWEGTVTFDSSYPTGGEAVAAADFGFNTEILTVLPVSDTGAEVTAWDSANSKVLVYTADGTQASNASDQSAVTATVRATGR